MAYTSRRGRRPAEYASKSAHTHVIRDPDVQAFLAQCDLPPSSDGITLPDDQRVDYEPAVDNPIRHVIAIDGGYTEVPVRVEFPSATICFFQFGALTFSVDDLEMLTHQPFIDPADISKLKRIQRLKLTLPVRNVALKSESTLTHSVRKAVHGFFQQQIDDATLIDTLRWFIFEEYKTSPSAVWQLANCPMCGTSNIQLRRAKMTKDYRFACDHCAGEIYLTDVFRLHEAVDDEIGAGGILGYVTTTIEQIFAAHFMRLILKIKPTILEQILFIRDGPLGFFGQTANMHKPMRELVRYLFGHHNLYMAGLEKSGAFVEHADEIAQIMPEGTALILDNDYIYKYIIPGKADPANPYGRTTYYGSKLIFKTQIGSMYVVSLPTTEVNAQPKAGDLRNLQVILTNIEKLKCDMYDSALMPVALANKLVSLSNHPSSRILQRFAVDSINH